MTDLRWPVFLVCAGVPIVAGLGVAASLGGNPAEALDIVLFVALPTFVPLAVLAARPVTSPAAWIAILAILAADWGWVMFEYSHPTGGGVNFAALSGAGIAILACIPALIVAKWSDSRRR